MPSDAIVPSWSRCSCRAEPLSDGTAQPSSTFGDLSRLADSVPYSDLRDYRTIRPKSRTTPACGTIVVAGCGPIGANLGRCAKWVGAGVGGDGRVISAEEKRRTAEGRGEQGIGRFARCAFGLAPRPFAVLSPPPRKTKSKPSSCTGSCRFARFSLGLRETDVDGRAAPGHDDGA
jgi:hypothetical protein